MAKFNKAFEQMCDDLVDAMLDARKGGTDLTPSEAIEVSIASIRGRCRRCLAKLKGNEREICDLCRSRPEPDDSSCVR